MSMNKSVFAALLTAATMSAAPSLAATVVYGSPSPSSIGDCTPSCTPQFQTVYSHTLFGSSPVSISAITYFLGSYGYSNSQNYIIRLSTSANPVGSLSSVFANNVGADVATFYSGVPTTPASPGLFTFSGTPFTYDPGLGDLLVDISHPLSDSGLYSSYEGATTLAQRVYAFDSSASGYSDGPGYAIATQFTVGPVTTPAVPEPATWAMMMAGFGLAGAAIRNRKAAVRFA